MHREGQMKRAYRFAGLLLLALVLTACASTTFTSTWKAPDAEPVGSIKGQKVVAFVVTTDKFTRRWAENVLTAELTKHGAQGIAGYNIVPEVTDEATAKELLEKSGAAGVVCMRPVDREVETDISLAAYTGPRYLPYWGGYYGYGWGAAWSPEQVHVKTIVSVETLVYSLKQNKLLWAGRSRTKNPKNVDALVREVASAAAKEMKKAGVI
jgi:hypothetical protein